MCVQFENMISLILLYAVARGNCSFSVVVKNHEIFELSSNIFNNELSVMFP